MNWSTTERTPEGQLKVTWGTTGKRYDRGYEEPVRYEHGSLLLDPSGSITISIDDSRYDGVISVDAVFALACAILDL